MTEKEAVVEIEMATMETGVIRSSGEFSFKFCSFYHNDFRNKLYFFFFLFAEIVMCIVPISSHSLVLIAI